MIILMIMYKHIHKNKYSGVKRADLLTQASLKNSTKCQKSRFFTLLENHNENSSLFMYLFTTLFSLHLKTLHIKTIIKLNEDNL